MPPKLKPREIQLDDDVRHFALLAKGHYVFPEQGIFLLSCRRICLMLWGRSDDEFVVRKVELAGAQALQDTTNYLIFDYDPSEEYKEVIRGICRKINLDPELEIRVQTSMLILLQWWWPENVWAGHPDPSILLPSDSVYLEEQEADSYRKWVEAGERMLAERKRTKEQERRF